MKLYVMFGQREENYPGQYGPEAINFIWDEYCVEENLEGFEVAKEEAEAKAKKDGFLRTKLFIIEVDSNKIDHALNKAPVLHGVIEDDLEDTGTTCSVCNAKQFNTPGGVTCANGHGGAEPNPK